MSIIKVVSKETIKPSTPTPNHLRNYKVSLLDQFSPSSYMPFIFFYPNKLPNNDNLETSRTFLIHLKESLSQILTIYYPLAGTVKDTVCVECNDQGVEFIEAHHSNGSLSDFLKQPVIATLNDFLPCNGNGLEKGPTISPVIVKATVFESCGGVVLGVCLFHKVVDAVAACEFLKSWAKISRGFKDDQVENLNFNSVSSLFPPKELSDVFVRDFDNFFFQGKKTFMRRYVFNATSIGAIRSKTASENIPKPSRLEALMAFVIQHMSKAFETAKSETLKTLMITHPINLRPRIDPPLPENTFGNVIWLAFAFYECDTNSESKIRVSELVENIREAFGGLDKESIEDLKTSDAFIALSELLESVYTNEKIKIYRFTSTLNMGFYDVDFGWGKPAWVAHMGDMVDYRSKQQIVFMETRNGKDVELWLAADEAELFVLENDQEFLAYATPNPSIFVDSDATN